MNCPKCNKPRHKTDKECPYCGVFFNKIKPKTAPLKAPQPEEAADPTKFNYKYAGIAAILIFSLLFSFSFYVAKSTNQTSPPTESQSSHHQASYTPIDVTYTIITDDRLRNIKRSVDVSLSEKTSKQTLAAIAQEIKESDPATYEKTFIGYFIKGEDHRQGYWATTHYKPNLNVKILGLTQNEEVTLLSQPTQHNNRTQLGSWLDNRPYVGSKMTLFRRHETLYMESIYKDGSSGISEMISTLVTNGRKIQSETGRDYGEYFIINSRGNLEFWSENGNYYTANTKP